MDLHRQMTQRKWRMNMGSLAFSMLSMWFINSQYSGLIVAELPFEPWGMVSGMSHRSIEGENMKNVGMFFIYSLLLMSFRGTFSKLLGN